VYRHVSCQSHEDTQDLASLVPFSGTPLSPMCETSLSNCYLEPAVTGSVFGKLLIDFSSFARRSLTSISGIADTFEGSAMPPFLDKVDSKAYATTQSGVGTVGGMRTFCCFVKKV